MSDLEVPREERPTKFQLRCKIGQRDAWRRAAEASGEDLSAWIRRVCDATAATDGSTSPEPLSPRRTRGGHDPAPRPERPAVRTERQANPADTARDPTPELASNCISANYHWRLQSGERCVSCGGVA